MIFLLSTEDDIQKHELYALLLIVIHLLSNEDEIQKQELCALLSVNLYY